MDIKVGSQILTLFSLFNKIAGIYGIIAVFQGGTIAQLSLYIYSIATIPIFIWGMKAISDVRVLLTQEKPDDVLRYAHIFILDQMISTGWTLLFAFWWFEFAAHDGKPVSNSSHQAGLMSLIESLESEYRTPEEMAKYRHKDFDVNTPEGQQEAARRARAANETWMAERGFSAGVLIGGWLIKVCNAGSSSSTLRSFFMRTRCTCAMALTGCCLCPSRVRRTRCMHLPTNRSLGRRMKRTCQRKTRTRWWAMYRHTAVFAIPVDLGPLQCTP